MRYAALTLILASALWASDARQELMEADRAFDRDTAARGLDGWMSWFDEDAQINARTGVIKGKAALREHYSKFIGTAGFSLRWQPLYAEASKDGTLGYTFGKGESVTTKPDGTAEKRPANYLTVWRKQKDGSWKVATDIGN